MRGDEPALRDTHDIHEVEDDDEVDIDMIGLAI